MALPPLELFSQQEEAALLPGSLFVLSYGSIFAVAAQITIEWDGRPM
jgi:hypothetical protein